MYKLSNLAAEDFASIFEYTLINFGGRQADEYTSDLENVLNILSTSKVIGRDFPKIGDGVYRHDHQRHAIFYRQRKKDIFVIRILHQQMDPMRHFFELIG